MSKLIPARLRQRSHLRLYLRRQIHASPTSTATNPAPMTTDSQPSLAPSDSPTSSCTNHATVAKHLNVSDNTAFKPGTNFAKVWLVENSGSCTWTTGYKLVFYDGNLISETSEIFLTKGVRPGENIELRINFMAPIDPALYMSDWYLQDLNGILFGVGASGNEPLHIQIEVRRYGTPIVI